LLVHRNHPKTFRNRRFFQIERCGTAEPFGMQQWGGSAMTIQMTPGTARPRPDNKKQIALSLGGAVLVLAAVVGLTIWQVNERDGTSAPTVNVSAVESPAGDTGQPAAAEQPSAVAVREQVIFLVGSAAQADDLYKALNEANAILASAGEPTRNDQVIVVEPTEAGDAIVKGIAAGQELRAEMGLPPIRLVDLRDQPVEGPKP
jgi:hypothetical protein